MIDKYRAQRLVKGSAKRKDKQRQKHFLSWYEHYIREINEEIKECARRGELTTGFVIVKPKGSDEDILLNREELQQTFELAIEAVRKKIVEQDFEIRMVNSTKEVIIDVSWE